MTGVVRGITLTLMSESGGNLPGACAAADRQKTRTHTQTRKSLIVKPPREDSFIQILEGARWSGKVCDVRIRWRMEGGGEDWTDSAGQKSGRRRLTDRAYG